MTLQDVFSVPEWDKLLGNFKTVVGIAPITLDATGTAVTSPCFTCEACHMIKSTPEGARRCKEGHIRMVARAKETRSPLIERCHAQLMKVTIPIYNGEEFLGITGGCNIADEGFQVNDQFFLQMASEIGVDGQTFLKEVKKIRKVPKSIMDLQVRTLKIRIESRISQLTWQRKSAPGAV